MTPRLTRRPEVRLDLMEIWSFIAKDSETSADRVWNAIEETFKLLLDTPEIGPSLVREDPRLAGLRFHPVKGYRNYIVYYRITPDGIDIVRVLHGSRNRGAILKDMN